ncbi:myb-like protein V, partial [Biomphalaria pfeifferi]
GLNLIDIYTKEDISQQEMDNIDKTLSTCFQEVQNFMKVLELSKSDEHVWINSLEQLESKMGLQGIEILQAMKILVTFCSSLTVLKNLMQVFVRKVTLLMDKLNLISDEHQSQETWKLVQNFWSLCDNLHMQLSGMAYGYTAEFYETLPSLASIFIDLFIAANRSKKKLRRLSKKLFGWLKFELNERCLKTALLEVSEHSPVGASIVFPILKKLLTQPLGFTDNLDYLLHIVLLKSWLPVCDQLKEIAETSKSLKAPETFVQWLKEKWMQSCEHLPEDKSLKGSRVSELLLELDETAVEELIDVFSNCLWSQYGAQDRSSAAAHVFVIDKKGNEPECQKDAMVTGKKRRKRKKKKSEPELRSLIVDDDNGLEIDSYMLTDAEFKKQDGRKESTESNLLRISISEQDEKDLMELTFSSDSNNKSSNKPFPDDIMLIGMVSPTTCQQDGFYLDRTSISSSKKRNVTKQIIPSSHASDSGESEVEILKDNLDLSCLSSSKSMLSRKRRLDDSEVIDITDETRVGQANRPKKIKLAASSTSESDDVEICHTKLKENMPKMSIPQMSSTNDVVDISDDLDDIAKDNGDKSDVQGYEIYFISPKKIKNSPLKMSPSPLKKGLKEVIHILEDQSGSIENEVNKINHSEELEVQIMNSPQKTKANSNSKKSPLKQKDSQVLDEANNVQNEKKESHDEVVQMNQHDNLEKEADVVKTASVKSPLKSKLITRLEDESPDAQPGVPSTTEQKISLMLTQIRQSVKVVDEKPLTNIKTRFRTKSETNVSSDKTEAHKSKKTLSDWLRKPSKAVKLAEDAVIANMNNDKVGIINKKVLIEAPGKRQSPRTKSNKSINQNETKTQIASIGSLIRERHTIDSEEESMKSTPKKKSPSQQSPFKRSYFLRNKHLAGSPSKCEVCSQDNKCLEHLGGQTPGRSQKISKKLNSDSPLSLSTPTRKRPSTPKI